MTSTEVASSLLASDDEGVAVCYLCLDGGLDDADQPLRRDCACRGTDAGFVHLECLTGLAASKSVQARNKDMKSFINPWEFCPSCRQKYQNELRIDIASEFVSFVRRQYPRDTQSQVESLFMKACAFDSILNMLKPVQKREFGVTATVLLSFINRMKGDASPLPMRYSQMEGSAYGVLGRIALNEGTEESARRAVANFENQLEINKAIGDDHGIAATKVNIADAKSKYDVGNSNEELLKASQEMYKLRIANLGEGHEDTIHGGEKYADALQKANRGDEARELLTKLLSTSKQVLGPHHNTTKELQSMLDMVVTL